MTDFEFSIRTNLKHAWSLFTKHVAYFLLLAAVMVVINLFSDMHRFPLASVAGTLLALFWSYTSLSSALAAVDGKDNMLVFDALKLHFPTVRHYVLFFGVIFGSAIIVLGGFILLIIPGIYFLVRLSFAQFAFIDRKEGVRASLRSSWNLVKGDVFWTVLLALMVVVFISALALIFSPIVLVFTYPISILFIALLYRALSKYKAHDVAVVEQPQEIPPTTPSSTTEQAQ